MMGVIHGGLQVPGGIPVLLEIQIEEPGVHLPRPTGGRGTGRSQVVVEGLGPLPGGRQYRPQVIVCRSL
jgi:hypothetical protein